MINKVILIGNLGQDPEVRYAASGTAVANFSLATNERVPAGEGQWEDRTEWHRIVVFGKTAENCANYLSKGSQIYVEGRLQTRQWEDRDGNKRYTTEVVAREVRFLGRKGGGANDQAREYQQDYDRRPQGGGRRQPNEGAYSDELPPPSGPPDDDIPF